MYRVTRQRRQSIVTRPVLFHPLSMLHRLHNGQPLGLCPVKAAQVLQDGGALLEKFDVKLHYMPS
jgi:hypothetical protein